VNHTTRRFRLVAILAVTALAVPIAAVAADRFTDVPDTNTFHDDINWLADNAITLGCDPAGTQFCPGDNVTRQQMAAFMRRLAESGAVDAGTLGGEPPSEYFDIIYASSSGTGILTGNPAVDGLATLETVEFETGRGAGVTIQNSVTYNGSSQAWMWVTVDQACATSGDFFEPVGAIAGTYGADLDSGTSSLAGGAYIEVDPGFYTLRLCGYFVGAGSATASSLVATVGADFPDV
jgi:hypothetical protein